MKSVKYKIERIKIIAEKFDETRKELVANQMLVVDLFKSLLDKYADEYSLTKNNSVRKLRFYSIVSRVKETESFSEKLIRNNDYNFFDNIVSDVENIDYQQLKKKIIALDDLIGIKILTDLNIDAINLFKLISSSQFIKDASNKGITIDSSDLNIQPVKMKNGLNIYKLRCKWDNWQFELQIKSKLDSAWGDMEHSIFYKDYKMTPVRDLAQQSMNHIGKLLAEIDEFLEDIREANKNYIDNSKAILFANKFEELYSDKVSGILDGISYNFKKIAALSYNINSNDTNILGAENLIFDHLSYSSEKYDQYINWRNEDFDLQIFESIIISNIGTAVSQENIDNSLSHFFEIISASYVHALLKNGILQDEELAQILVANFFETCVDNHCREFILNTENVMHHIENLNLLSASIEVLELPQEEIFEMQAAYTIFSFHGEIVQFSEKIDKDVLLENLEKAKNEMSKIKVVQNTIKDDLNSLINILG